jgi:hypothetical protein
VVLDSERLQGCCRFIYYKIIGGLSKQKFILNSGAAAGRCSPWIPELLDAPWWTPDSTSSAIPSSAAAGRCLPWTPELLDAPVIP